MFVYSPPDTFNPEKHFKSVPFYQGVFFKRWQEANGRDVISLAVDVEGGETIAYIQCVEYVFPIVGSVWVAAQGPLGTFESIHMEEVFYTELKRVCAAASTSSSHVRIQRTPSAHHIHTISAEKYSGDIMQPFSEQSIVLDEPLDDIIVRFSNPTRDIVKRYEHDKDLVQFVVERINFTQYLVDVYDLLVASNEAGECTLQSFKYYETLFSELQVNPEYGMLALCYIRGKKKLVSATLVLYSGGEAFHLFSCNSKESYSYDVPTLSLYTAIKESKEQRLERFNLGDIASSTPYPPLKQTLDLHLRQHADISN